MATELVQGPGPGRARRALQLGGVVLATAVAVWCTWPRPALTITVEPGGRAYVEGGLLGPLARRALPETVVVSRTGHRAMIRVVNHDARRQQLGFFGAAPGQTRDYVVSEPGVLSGACSAHKATGRLTYLIR